MARLDVVNAAGLVRPLDRALLQIEFPATHAGDASRAVEEVLAVAQAPLRLHRNRLYST